MPIPSSSRVAEIAAHLYAQHSSKEPHKGFEGTRPPIDLAEAYDVQFALHDLFVARGHGSLAGHKIALTSKPMQAFCGVDHPIAGGLFSEDIHPSPCDIRLTDFQRLAIEFELAFEIGDAALWAKPPFDRHSVREIVVGCRPSFELAEDRRAVYGELVALGLAADNAWCGGVVLGPRLDDWHTLDLDNLPVTLFCNDEARQHASTGAADPLGSLAWVANHLAEHGRRFEPGQFVITGSPIEPRFPHPGDHIRCDVNGLAEVAVHIQ
jgi:2-keto-4-pentenoate hydratase